MDSNRAASRRFVGPLMSPWHRRPSSLATHISLAVTVTIPRFSSIDQAGGSHPDRSALCSAASGPYPTPSMAINNLSALAPLTVDVIADYLRSGPVGAECGTRLSTERCESAGSTSGRGGSNRQVQTLIA